MSNSNNALDMGARSAIQTSIAMIIAPAKKKKKKKKNVKKNIHQTNNNSKKRKSATSSYNSDNINNNRIVVLPDKINVKKISDVCQYNANHCISAKESLFETMTSYNSHIRLLILQVINQLFLQHEKFRKEVVNDLRNLVLLCIGDTSNLRGQLPPPAKFAKFLKDRFIDMFEDWHLNHGTDYKALRVAYTYMQEKRGIVFLNRNPNKRLRINNNNNNNNGNQKKLSSYNMENAWRDFLSLKNDTMNIEDVEDAVKIVEEALTMLLTNQIKRNNDEEDNVDSNPATPRIPNGG